MKKGLITILFLISVIMLLPGGCTYYYPLDYDPAYETDNRGFFAPFDYYSPYGAYSYYPYPYTYPYGYYYPSSRFYFGERPEGGGERHFYPGERSGGER